MKLSDEMREDICGTAAIYVDKVAQLEGDLALSQMNHKRMAECLEESDAAVVLLEAKLTAIECGDCGLTMLECKCDDLEDG